MIDDRGLGRELVVQSSSSGAIGSVEEEFRFGVVEELLICKLERAEFNGILKLLEY